VRAGEGAKREAGEACIAHLRLPITHGRATRTTNLLERLFVEERRRLKIIPNAFGEKVVFKLMFGAMTADCNVRNFRGEPYVPGSPLTAVQAVNRHGILTPDRRRTLTPDADGWGWLVSALESKG
jgi:hypothetical protein